MNIVPYTFLINLALFTILFFISFTEKWRQKSSSEFKHDLDLNFYEINEVCLENETCFLSKRQKFNDGMGNKVKIDEQKFDWCCSDKESFG